MTTLELCYSDIPFFANKITPAATTHSYQNEFNLISKERYQRFQFASAATSNSIVWDLGSDYANKQATVDYLAIARYDLLANAGVSGIVLASSSDNSSYTDRITIVVTSNPENPDYISTISATSAFRYWRITWSGSSNKFIHSKDFFGTRFTFNTAPHFEIERAPGGTSPFVASSGAKHLGYTSEPVYHFQFKWKGLTEAKIKSFQNSIARYSHRCGYMLYAPTQDQILDGNELVHCKLVNSRARIMYNNWWELETTFEQMVG